MSIAERMPAPDRYDTYVEPFYGAGAVFFELANQGRLANKQCILTDADPSVALIMQAVQADPQTLHEQLDYIRKLYNGGSYEQRGQMFVNVRTRWNDPMIQNEAHEALFLRATTFNGLWRSNRSGKLNSPWGKYEAISFPGLDQLKATQDALENAKIVCQDFRQTFQEIEDPERTLVYCDPPYFGGFTDYVKAGFGPQDQIDLIIECAAQHTGGQAYVFYSNAPKDFIRESLETYWEDCRVVGLSTKRSVAAAGEARKVENELLAIGRP